MAALEGSAGLVFDRAKLFEMPLAVIQLIGLVERVQIKKKKKSLSENGSNQPLITALLFGSNRQRNKDILSATSSR